MESGRFDLQRFVDAQAPCWQQVQNELVAGQKRSHWMWFVFPQVHGLGSSPTARRFAISGLDEAIAYLHHPILGARLHDSTMLVNAVTGRSISEIFAYPDDRKFHSSMTLFAAAQHEPAFTDALEKFFAGTPDQATLDRLRTTRSA